MKKAGASSVCPKCENQYCAGKRNIKECVNETKQDKLARDALEKQKLTEAQEEAARKQYQELKDIANAIEAEKTRLEKEFADIEYDNTPLMPPDIVKKQDRIASIAKANPQLVLKSIYLEEKLRLHPNNMTNIMAYFEHEVLMSPLYFIFREESDNYINLVLIYMAFKSIELRCTRLRTEKSFPLTLITDATTQIEKLVAVIQPTTETQKAAVAELCAYIQHNRTMVDESTKKGLDSVPNTNAKYYSCLTNLSVTCNKLAAYVDTLIVDMKVKNI